MQLTRKLPLTVLIVGAAMLMGGALRLYQVSERSMTHPEMFVPGIPLRADLSVPPPRMDLARVIGSDLFWDTHPPGYYILMLMVTKCFGTSTLALRLPSVLFGVASIGLVFWLGSLVGQRIPGCVAALLLAFSGYHIVWSRSARSYSMVCFLGLLATILLLLLARATRHRKAVEFGYAALMIYGICTYHPFWGLLATQMVWVLGNAWYRGGELPRALNVQILIMILASPLFAVAELQSRNEVSGLSSDVLLMGRQFIQFFFLIPMPFVDDTCPADRPPGLVIPQHYYWLLAVFFVFCALLLIVGVRQLRPADDAPTDDISRPFAAFWSLAMIVATIAIVALGMADAREIASYGSSGVWGPTLKTVRAMAALPLSMLIGAIVLNKFWHRLRNLGAKLPLRSLAGGQRLVLLITIIPFAMLAFVSLFLRPLMNARGLLYVEPFLLLTLACGIVAVARRSRWVAIPLVLILASLHAFSVEVYNDRIISQGDFGGLAAKLTPQIRSGDLFFIHRDWYTTPILYYIRPDRYKVDASDFTKAVQRDPQARVWVLLFGKESPEPGITQALQGYRQVETVDSYLGQAKLYCRDDCQ
jgi:4-amino-4-deoxy-L-arabinose transferase-like glycosyltransferase